MQTSTQSAPPVTCPALIREGTPDDLPFVRSTWLRCMWPRVEAQATGESCRCGCPRHKRRNAAMDRRVWECGNGIAFASVLTRGILKIAHDPESAITVWGFSISEMRGSEPILHYVYVRHQERRQGIARALVAHLPKGFAFTHWSMDAAQYMHEHHGGLVGKLPLSNPFRPSEGKFILPTPDGVPVYVPQFFGA